MGIAKLGLILGGFLIGLGVGNFYHYADKPTRAELQREFDGYRMCMQAAGKNRCSMQPLDFVRYVEIKHLLSIRTEIIERN